MKYRFLLRLLTILIYSKRAIWWLGRGFSQGINRIAGPVIKTAGYLFYRAESQLSRKLGLDRGLNRRIFKRDNLQVIILIILFFLAIPQTKIYSKSTTDLPGRDTIAYNLVGTKEDFGELEEVLADTSVYDYSAEPPWKHGVVSSEDFVATDFLQHDQELAAGVVAGGVAVSKPVVFPGTFTSSAGRTETITHVVQPGETISDIAFQYGVSVATILWENDLSSWSLIRPGDSLSILPVSGLTYTVRSGDTLGQIASNYGGEVAEIVKFNKLNSDGSDLRVGENIIIPDGVKYYTPAPTVVAKTTPSYSTVGTPANSTSRPSSSGWVWPAAMRIITQYYNWAHYGLDISGPVGSAYGSAIYASKSGTVEVSQCGWNMGYGCYVVINHGGGYKTLYGHNSQLLVNVGDYVTAGQTISLMGNTGRVYGYDGTHVHFEVQVNGVRVNPLNYVR